MIVAPDGAARLELGEDRASVRIEDTPWVVTQVDGDPGAGFTVVLNDGSREPLDPTTLSTSPEHVLYCRVKSGHPARFLRPAYYALVRFAEAGPGGAFVLPLAGHHVLLPAPGA